MCKHVLYPLSSRLTGFYVFMGKWYHEKKTESYGVTRTTSSKNCFVCARSPSFSDHKRRIFLPLVGKSVLHRLLTES